MMETYKTNMPELSLKYKKGDFKKFKLQCSKDVYDFAKEAFDADTIEYSEEIIALFLNQSNNTLAFMKISTGGTTGAIMDVKVIMSSALLSGAQGIILIHNHPSGETNPSGNDRKTTEKVKKAAELLDMHLLDHLIVTPQKYYSFADEDTI